LDGSLPKLCPAVTLSHQDGCHSAVALLLKAALIQVSDYRLLGASGLFFIIIFNYIPYNIKLSMIRPVHVGKGKLNKYILKASVDKVILLDPL
jgi:hypothetical protein